MPSTLSKYQRGLSRELILSGLYSNEDIAAAVHCNVRAIQRHRRNLRVFGSISGLPNQGDSNPKLTKSMIAALLRHLFEKPDLYLDEMAWFLWDEFQVSVSASTISRALHYAGWSKKQVKCNFITTKVSLLIRYI
jgi:transposase